MITIGKPKNRKPFFIWENTKEKFYIWLEKKQLIGWDLLKSKKKFIKLWGGARSGKTFLIIVFIIARAIRYKYSTHLVARYSHTTCKKTVWRQTMLPILRVLKSLGFCEINYSQAYAYFPNSESYIFTGGLRPTDIGNVLSSEFASIFVCEAFENSWSVIEDLKTRLNSTAIDDNENLIPLKFIIDLNPTVKGHWSNVVWLQGINPTSKEPIRNYNQYANLHFDPIDNVENLAEGYIDDLKDLSGAKRRRFYDGQYGTFEGLVFHLDDSDIIDDNFKIEEKWEKIIAIDFGYVHPFVALWLAVDNSETVYLYREYVQRQRTINHHAKQLKKYHKFDLTGQDRHINDTYNSIVCDHDAGDRAILRENGINTINAFKDINSGVDRVIDFLERHKLKIFRSCVNTIEGLNSVRWRERETGVRKDREILKENDDETDALRYGFCELFPLKRKASTVKITGL